MRCPRSKDAARSRSHAAARRRGPHLHRCKSLAARRVVAAGADVPLLLVSPRRAGRRGHADERRSSSAVSLARFGHSDVETCFTTRAAHVDAMSLRRHASLVLMPQRAGGGQCCNRRVALYLRGHVFGYRRCCGLTYPSQQEGSRDRSVRRARKARLRLGGSPSLLDPLPARPKGMRARTYDRLLGKALIAVERWADLQVADLRRRYSGGFDA